MSERQPESEQFNFTELDSAMSDPYIERVFEQVRSYNDLMKGAVVEGVDRKEIIAELDAQWGTLLDAPMTMSGVVRTIDAESNEQKDFVLDGSSVISKGFATYIEQLPLEDESIELYSVKHLVSVPWADIYPEVVDPAGDKGVTHIMALADIDQTVIEIGIPSVERATAWLSVCAPELIEDIDVLISKDYADTESEALLSLQSIDFNEYTDLSDEFTRRCVNVYLNNVLDFDTKVPYFISVIGHARAYNEQGHVLPCMARMDAGIIDIQGVTLQEQFSDEGDLMYNEKGNLWVMTVNTTLHSINKDVPTQDFLFDLNGVTSLKSIRNYMYGL